jgi:hypothetical protein
MPRIGAVERLVAEREVGNDVAFDRDLQQRPLKPGRIAQMAAGDAAVAPMRSQTNTSPRKISTSAKPSRGSRAFGISALIGPSGRRAKI